MGSDTQLPEALDGVAVIDTVRDDPEGAVWDELGAGDVEVIYREWSTGQQGWDVRSYTG